MKNNDTDKKAVTENEALDLKAAKVSSSGKKRKAGASGRSDLSGRSGTGDTGSSTAASGASGKGENKNRYEDFYRKFRRKITIWIKGRYRHYKYADIILLAPDLLHLLIRLALSSDLPSGEKAKLYGALAYFLSPVDFIPDFLGPVGFLDDIVLSVFVLNGILNRTGPDILRRYWAGSGDILDALKKVTAIADELIGAGLLYRIRKILKEEPRNSGPRNSKESR